LNLGCGSDVRPDWVNLDRNPDVLKAYPDVTKADVFKRLPYADGSVAEIYAGHVLEYQSYHRIPDVIAEWVRVLEPGGTITIAVPDFEAIARDYVSGRMQYLTAIITLYGAHQDRYDYRKTAIDWAMIAGQLGWWGCEDVERLLSPNLYELVARAKKARPPVEGEIS
jgi:predicted SAM-dependent methyltransferase